MRTESNVRIKRTDCGYIQRKIYGVNKLPLRPLNKTQRERLTTECLQDCIKDYQRAISKEGLLNDTETKGDLIGEAWEMFQNTLEKFDLTRIGKTGKVDIEGKEEAKTLAFYFRCLFKGQIRQTISGTRRDLETKRRQSESVSASFLLFEESYSCDY